MALSDGIHRAVTAELRSALPTAESLRYRRASHGVP